MIKVENIQTWGFEHAIRGMRNPYDSWAKSDSTSTEIGPKDLELMRKLYLGGSEHRKYMRQIFVSMDITAPLYWWKEFDTYKVGTCANSCSTMHTLCNRDLTIDDFSFDNPYEIDENIKEWLYKSHVLMVKRLNSYIEAVRVAKDKHLWREIIQILPCSYNQKRTITMNYENAVAILKQRKGHKLKEWNDFCEILLCNLPYLKDIIS